ncbi:MAG: response regulator [Lachnospiraceae bacterium]|nr:response regulator [Lachnospiraceae bacterium]
MAQATDLVVLISSSEGIIVKGMERKLQDAGVNVEHCMPVVNLVKKYDDRSAIYVVYLSGDADAMSDALIYINDIVREEEKDLIVIGENTEKQELQRNHPYLRISEWVLRPLDMEGFAAKISDLLKQRAIRMTEKSILVVDDDPSFARIVRDWLKDDYQVFIVTSGMQAISFLMKKNVDLVLLDYEMPVTTGPQVLRMLRSEPDTAGIPIVFLTGIGDAESVKQVIALKPDGYILKSTPRPELLKWLKIFFGKRA